MSADRKWAAIGITVTAIGVVATVWYMSLGDLHQAAVDLYTAGKISDEAFVARTSLLTSARLMPLFVMLIGLLSFLAYRQWTRVARIWRYAWPVLALLAAVAPLTAAALLGGDVLVGLLAIVPPLFIAYLLRSRLRLSLRTLVALPSHLRVVMASALQRRPWEYDFLEHLANDTTRCYSTGDAEPWSVRKVRNALSDGYAAAEAIFEHPPYHGDTVIEYAVTGIENDIREVWIEGGYAILERFDEYDGQRGEPTHFQPNTDNRVRFEVHTDGEAVWDHEIDDFRWFPLQVGPFHPQGGRLTVEFRTNALGKTSCNWAAWADLKLVECL